MGGPRHERNDVNEERTPDDAEEPYSPPDEPEGSFEDATTASGALEGETIDERLARERPEDARGQAEPVGRLAEEDRPDTEPELIGELSDDEDDDLTSEEAAMRVGEDAPGATADASDGYVDREDA